MIGHVPGPSVEVASPSLWPAALAANFVGGHGFAVGGRFGVHDRDGKSVFPDCPHDLFRKSSRKLQVSALTTAQIAMGVSAFGLSEQIGASSCICLFLLLLLLLSSYGFLAGVDANALESSGFVAISRSVRRSCATGEAAN